MDAEQLAHLVADEANARKALNVVLLDVRGQSSYTDFIIVASGTSDRHVQSIAESVERMVRNEGTHALGTEGIREGQWALLDFGPVVLHVFHQFTRDVYNLEGLWKDAPRIAVASSTAPAATGARS